MRSLLAFGLFVTALLAQAQDPITLKRIVKKDDKSLYTSVIDLDYGTKKATIETKLQERVMRIDDRGRFEVETQYIVSQLTIKDTKTDLEQSPDVMTFDPSGDLVSIRTNSSPAIYRGAMLFAVYLPSAPVKIDEVWKRDIKGDSKIGTVTIHAEFKVTKIEKVGELECAVVAGTIKETEGSVPASIDETMWLNLADGSLVKRTATIKALPTGISNPATADAKVTVTRDLGK